MKSNRVLPLGLLLLGFAPVVLTPGCGGSNNNGTTATAATATTTGRAKFTIVWPKVKSSRVIPRAANSIHVLLKRGETVVAQKVVARPESGMSTVTFENLPVDTLTMEAAAYPNADGTGTAQAYGITPATVRPGETTVVALTLGSTIDRLQPFTSSVWVTEGGGTNTVPIIAYTADNAIVLTKPEQFAWSGSNAFFSVDNVGKVTGIAQGSGTLTVRETESGKSLALPVTVFSRPPAPPVFRPIAVTFDPDTVKVSIRKTLQLSVNVTGDGFNGVTWRVEEAGEPYEPYRDESRFGRVNPDGMYYPPLVPGTFHVIATSVADPTKSARVTIQVVAGSAEGTIQ